MSRIIDRRLNGRHKSAVNRQRFMQRYKKQIQDAVHQAINNRSIKEIDEFGEKISIPTKDTLEPFYHYGEGGIRNIILPGNKEFISGDRIKRPLSSSTQSGSVSNTGEGQDEFVFEISKEEFLDLFFEDLALPNLVKTQLTKIPRFKMNRAGYSASGIPKNINVIRSLRGALGRRIALKGQYTEKLNTLQKELTVLLSEADQIKNKERIHCIQHKIEEIKNKIKHLPFLDPIDIRYNRREKIQIPTTQAVMFCIMDVSGSMDERKKNIAKQFFILLYLFLSRNYDNIELVFIRHHTIAKEVDEQEFFYSRETGGTVVSSALELMQTILTTRYPTSDWNIYAAQASDGDNWNNDALLCKELLLNHILPLVQYFAYIEIMPQHHQSLWDVYEQIRQKNQNFAIQHIEGEKDIYPVLRSLFKHSNRSGKAEN